jgi:hypothetical protein
MVQKLRRIYFILILPVVIGFIVVCYLKSRHLLAVGPYNNSGVLPQLLFILAAGTAMAYPILLRAVFAHRNQFEKFVLKCDLLKFERYLIAGPLLTPYLALLAYYLELPEFYTIGIFLMSLYASYYFYPSKRRIALEQQIFRSY